MELFRAFDEVIQKIDLELARAFLTVVERRAMSIYEAELKRRLASGDDRAASENLAETAAFVRVDKGGER